MPDLAEKGETPVHGDLPVILVAINDETLWLELEEHLSEHFRLRRETNGLRTMDVLMLIRPAALIAETGLPGLSGILLARLMGHNRFLSQLPVALILSRDYLIEEFWAKESGALITLKKDNVSGLTKKILSAIHKARPISDEHWNAAETAIRELGGPAASAANELERQLIGASVITRLGEVDFRNGTEDSENRSTISNFVENTLGALSSVLEFSIVGITLFDSNKLFLVENTAFSDVKDKDSFIRETRNSVELYKDNDQSGSEIEITELKSVNNLFPGSQGPASTFFALPLIGTKGNYALLSMMTYKDIAVREYYLRMLSLIGSQLSVSLERALFHEEVRRLSITDSTTGLANHRSIFSRLEEEFKRAVRYRMPLSIAICDLDDFKKINDRYGHLAGDAVLRSVASIIGKSVREVDLAGRWGGEEMALIFPQTDLRGALIAAERVRSMVDENIVEFMGNSIRVTFSIGVATLDPEFICITSSNAMVALADNAMYLAKSRGKNRIAHYLELISQVQNVNLAKIPMPEISDLSHI